MPSWYKAICGSICDYIDDIKINGEDFREKPKVSLTTKAIFLNIDLGSAHNL